MAESISLSGVLTIGDSCGGCATLGGGSSSSRALALGPCGDSAYYQSIVQTGGALSIATPGAVGAVFEDLDLLGDLAAIEFLYARVRGPLILRIGADVARLIGVGGTFPTGFAGGETLTLEIDGVAVSVVFDVADQTVAQVVARINAAIAFAGLPAPLARVTSLSQVSIESVATGAQGTVEVTGGTGAATLGLTGSAAGTGEDQRVEGLFLAQYDKSAPPARVQVSGSGTIELVAAGRAA